MKLGEDQLTDLRNFVSTLNTECYWFGLDIAVMDNTEVVGYIRRDPDEDGVGYYFVGNR